MLWEYESYILKSNDLKWNRHVGLRNKEIISKYKMIKHLQGINSMKP